METVTCPKCGKDKVLASMFTFDYCLECAELEETTWGQDIDSFVLHNFLKDERKLATIQIHRIVLKAFQSQLHELMEKFSPSSK